MLRVEHYSFLVGLAALKNMLLLPSMFIKCWSCGISPVVMGCPPFAVSFSFQGLASCVLLHLMQCFVIDINREPPERLGDAVFFQLLYFIMVGCIAPPWFHYLALRFELPMKDPLQGACNPCLAFF